MRIEEVVDEEPLDRVVVVADLLVALALLDYTLEVHPGGSVSATPELSQAVDLTEGDLSDAELLLATATTTLRGVVVTPRGIPVPHALVRYEVDRRWSTCWGRSSAHGPAVLSDGDGRFSFSGVTEAAPLVLEARDSSGHLGFLVDFDPTSEGEARLIMAPTGSITLRREESLRRDDCWIQVRGPDECIVTASRWTRGEATWVIGGLPSHLGDLRLDVQCGVRPAIQRAVTIAPGASVDLLITPS